MSDFFWGYLPFWIINFGLSAIAWTCLGRFLLSFLLPPASTNYIWRFFRRLTDWAVDVTRLITPSHIGGFWLPPIAAWWLFVLRFGAFFLLASHGMIPAISRPAGG